jgi:hypothetical protein
MGQIGPEAFFLFLAILFAALALYAAWRMTRRAAPSAGAGYAAVVPSASPVAVDAVLDRASERAAERSPG